MWVFSAEERAGRVGTEHQEPVCYLCFTEPTHARELLQFLHIFSWKWGKTPCTLSTGPKTLKERISGRVLTPVRAT